MKKGIVFFYSAYCLAAIFLLYLSLFGFTKSIVVVPAFSYECLSVSVPSCGDVYVKERGFPAVTREELSGREDVSEPYASAVKDRWVVGAIAVNSAIVILPFTLGILLIHRYKKSKRLTT